MADVRGGGGALRELAGNRFLRAVGRGLGLEFANLLIRLLSIALVSRLLPADAFGIYFLGQSIAILLGIVGNLSFSYRVMEVPTLDTRAFLQSMAWPFVAAAGMATAAWLAAQLVLPGYSVALLGGAGLAIAATGPALAALRTAEALARRLLEFRNLAWAETIATALGLLLVAPALALAGFGAWALAAGHGCYLAIKLGLLLGHDLRHLPSALDAAHAPPARSGRLAAYGLEVLDSVSVHLMRLVIGAAFGPAVVALWTRALQLVLLGVNLLMAPLANVLVPLALRDGARREQLRAEAPLILDNLALLLLPPAFAAFVLAPEIALLVLGAGWTDVVPYLQAFSLLILGRTLQRAFGILGRATHTGGVRLLIDISAFLAYMPTVAVLISLGPIPAAWAFSITTCIAAFLHFSLVGISPVGDRLMPWRYLLSNLGLAIAIGTFQFLELNQDTLTFRTLLTLGSGVVIYFAISVISCNRCRPGGVIKHFLRNFDHATIR